MSAFAPAACVWHRVIDSGRILALLELLQAHPINVVRTQAPLVFQWACGAPQACTALAVLGRYVPELVDEETSRGERALWRCLHHEREEEALVLLALGADPHGLSNDGTSPLAHALRAGLTRVAEALLGLRAGIRTEELPQLLEWAVQSRADGAFDQALAAGATWEVLNGPDRLKRQAVALGLRIEVGVRLHTERARRRAQRLAATVVAVATTKMPRRARL